MKKKKQGGREFIYWLIENKNCHFIKHTVYFQFLSCPVSHSCLSKFIYSRKFLQFKEFKEHTRLN